MRKTLNDNPVVQIVMLGVLGILVAVLFVTRVMGGNEAVAPAATVPDATAVTPVPGEAAPASSAPEPAPSPAVSGFEAGAGLPAGVVRAHKSGDVVALLVIQDGGIEDSKLRRELEALRGDRGTTIFVAEAAQLTRYSRIAEGVDLDRVPALVVIHPAAGKRTSGELPIAAISYGFRGLDAVRQAIADARYDGKDLPYHPG